MTEKSFDVVVVGGGIAGICAAISAARLGCEVALVHDRPVLGGNDSSECRVGISGADYGPHRHARETGIVEEIRFETKIYRNPPYLKSESPTELWGRKVYVTRNPAYWPMHDAILREWIEKEPNITLYLNTEAKKAVTVEPNRIEGVVIENTLSKKQLYLKGTIFIDSSGDGVVAHSAGAIYRMGREARSEFNESLAPLETDNCVQPATIVYIVEDVGRPVPYIAPLWAKDLFPSDEDLPGRHHGGRPGLGWWPLPWWMETGGTLNMIDDHDKIWNELTKIAYGMWDHIKNHGDHGAENYTLNWVGLVVAKRESRRIIGDYILTQNDVMSQKLFPDRVAYGGWPIDIHVPEGIYAKTPSPFECAAEVPGLYSIPFRCLYSKNIENLMMAGRDVSVSHVALGTTRVIAQCALMGQTVGVAAWLCRKYGTNPRGVYEKHIVELQQLLLKHDCYIIRLKNEDPNDLALEATVLASSSKTLEVTSDDELFELDTARAQMFLVTEPLIESISLCLQSVNASDTDIRLGLRRTDSLRDFSSEEDIATSTATVPANARSWVKFVLNQPVAPKSFYWVWLPATEGIHWCGTSGHVFCPRRTEPMGTRRGRQVEGRWQAERERGSYCFKLTPLSKPYGGENVTNGFARPEDKPNIWISDTHLPMPQYVELRWESPKTIDTVYLTYNTRLDLHHLDECTWTGDPVPECVRDYALYYNNGTSWVKILEEKGNYQRHRIHTFGSVTTRALRLEVKATNGADTAEVYEIRCYHECQ